MPHSQMENVAQPSWLQQARCLRYAPVAEALSRAIAKYDAQNF